MYTMFVYFSAVGRSEGSLFAQPEATFVKEVYVFTVISKVLEHCCYKQITGWLSIMLFCL